MGLPALPFSTESAATGWDGSGSGGDGPPGGAQSPGGFDSGPTGRDRVILVVGIVIVVALFVGGVIWRSGSTTPPPDLATAGAEVGDEDDETERATPAQASETAWRDFGPAPGPEAPPEGYTPEELNTHFGDAVWRVESDGCGFESGGSAFAVSPHHLVSNEHVAVIDTMPTLVSRNGESQPGRVIGMTEEPDLAIIEVDEPMEMWLDWAPTDQLLEGQPLVAMGYPLPAADFTVTSVAIGSFERDGELKVGIRGDGRIDRGNSGGPSLTADGRVAGINTAVNINQGGQSTGLFGGGFQVVPLIVTLDAVEPHLERLLTSTETVPANCARVDPSQASSYGDNVSLDALWEECDAGNPWGCDELYQRSRVRTEYELFGRTCGNRTSGTGYCANRFRGWMVPNAGSYLDIPGIDEAMDEAELREFLEQNFPELIE